MAQKNGLEGHILLVSSSLCRKLSNLQFSHDNLDDLDEGIHPFIISVKSPQDQAALNKHLYYYDSLNDGGMAVNLKDLQTLSEKDKAALPKTLLQDNATSTISEFFS